MRNTLLFPVLLWLFGCAFAPRTWAATEPYWNWRNPTPQGNDYTGVAYGNGRFVAVGAAGTITTSTDGVTWTAANSGVNFGLSCVAYGNGRFVAKGYVADTSGLLISDDGVSWRRPTAIVPSGWRSVTLVTYAGDRFFAMSNSAFEAQNNVHIVATSTDGENWTQSDSGTAAKVGRVAFGGGIYLGQDMMTGDLKSSDGVTWTYTEVKMLHSADGLGWEAGGGTGLASLSGGPVYFADRWVVAGTIATISGGTQQFHRGISSSADGGATWTVTWSDADGTWGGNAPIAGMTEFGGRLILLGDPNVPILSTADLITVRHDRPTQFLILNSAVATADRVVVVGRYGQILSSTDGTNWTSPTASPVTGYLRGAAFGDGQWIVAGDVGLAASPDGIVWRMLSDGPRYPEGSVAFGNGRFVAGTFDGHVSVSTDQGGSWTDSGAVGVHGQIAFAQGRFVAASGLKNSTDGVAWSSAVAAPGGTGSWTGICQIDGVFYAIGTTDPNQEKDGVIARSTDGIAWTTVATMSEQLVSVGGKAGLLVACGFLGEVWTSTDGLSWQRAAGRPLNAFGPAGSVLWVGDSLVAATYYGQVVTSDDGVTWTKDEFASSGLMFAMAAGNGQVLAVGAGGAIWEVGAARFTTQPQSRTVNDGATVTFSVGATGKEPLSYQWMKDGVPVGTGEIKAFSAAKSAAVLGAKSRTLTIAGIRAGDAGSYSVVVTNSFGSTQSNSATLVVAPSAAAPAIATQPEAKTVTAGSTVTFSVVATGDAPLSYQWRKAGAAIAGATAASYTIAAAAVGDGGSYSVEVSNGAGAVTSNEAVLTVTPPAVPAITTQPEPRTVNAGQSVTLSVSATGAAPLTYQWLKDNEEIAGATEANYTIPAAAAVDGGTYTVLVRNGAGATTSTGVTLTVMAAQLVNISTRAYATTANGVSIGGFVISGASRKPVLIRAVGPSLAKWGVPTAEVLQDPNIELHHGDTTLATNDDWGANTNAGEITDAVKRLGAQLLDAGDTKSAAIFTTLDPGIYTVVVKGGANSSGIVLLEIYDAEANRSSFANISTRARCTTNNGVTIGGFVVTGNVAKRVLMRAVGPTLATKGLDEREVLLDPMLELRRGDEIVGSNDNWGDNADAAEIATVGARIGATPFDVNDTKSAALLRALQPGVYTVIAKGKNETSGLVLVEIYDAD